MEQIQRHHLTNKQEECLARASGDGAVSQSDRHQLVPTAEVSLKNCRNLETRPSTKYHEFRAKLDLATRRRHSATRITVLKQYRMFLSLQTHTYMLTQLLFGAVRRGGGGPA